MHGSTTCTVFADTTRISSGSRAEVTDTARALFEADDPRVILIFDDVTGTQLDIDLRGPIGEVTAPETPSPGRPKLGVIGREVTLLPRHWEWLNAQPGGASVALRKLVEMGRRNNETIDRVRRSQEATFRFISAIAGNEAGYEEANRALFAANPEAFDAQTRAWPSDVREFARALAADALGLR